MIFRTEFQIVSALIGSITLHGLAVWGLLGHWSEPNYSDQNRKGCVVQVRLDSFARTLKPGISKAAVRPNVANKTKKTEKELKSKLNSTIANKESKSISSSGLKNPIIDKNIKNKLPSIEDKKFAESVLKEFPDNEVPVPLPVKPKKTEQKIAVAKDKTNHENETNEPSDPVNSNNAISPSLPRISEPSIQSKENRQSHTTMANARASYEALVRSRLALARHYPYIARRLRKEGIVRISFYVDEKGAVSDLIILKSSKIDILDQATKEIVREITPLPPPPNGPVRLSFSFRYTLKEDSFINIK